MINKIKKLSVDVLDDVIAFREHLHQYPELYYQEYETTKFIASKLDKLNVTYRLDYAETGVVALIEGKNPSKKCIALRADIDALPIAEQNKVTYKSKHEGVMHACGHDVHSACLFGAISILSQCKQDFEGTIKCIFQPAEEKLPGGASILIKNGVLQNPKVEEIIALHVFPELEVGKVGFRSGQYMASADEIHIKVNGVGGHAALATTLKDPIIASNHLLIELRKAIDSMAEKEIPYVIGFGFIEAKGATNVIPDSVSIKGTFRTMNEAWRKRAHQAMQLVKNRMEKQFGVSIDLNILYGYPVLKNDSILTKQAKQQAIELLGDEYVIDLPIRMSSEDFSYYSQEIPGCFFRLGTASRDGSNNSLVHTPTFNIDNQALQIGTMLLANLAISRLK